MIGVQLQQLLKLSHINHTLGLMLVTELWLIELSARCSYHHTLKVQSLNNEF